jgi:hypothetical protein
MTPTTTAIWYTYLQFIQQNHVDTVCTSETEDKHCVPKERKLIQKFQHVRLDKSNGSEIVFNNIPF